MLTLPADGPPLLGGLRPRNAAEGCRSARVPVQPRGREVGGSDRLRAATGAEPDLHREGQGGDAAEDAAHGHGHQQRRSLGAVLRLRRLLLLRPRLHQVHHLQAPRLLIPSVPTGKLKIKIIMIIICIN